eukprot:5646023-Prymnesium_polylepis.1
MKKLCGARCLVTSLQAHAGAEPRRESLRDARATPRPSRARTSSQRSLQRWCVMSASARGVSPILACSDSSGTTIGLRSHPPLPRSPPELRAGAARGARRRRWARRSRRPPLAQSLCEVAVAAPGAAAGRKVLVVVAR